MKMRSGFRYLKIVIPVFLFSLMIGFFPRSSSAQTARIEVHLIRSMTLTAEQFLKGSKEGKPAEIGGELRLPMGAGRFPAVLLIHGSGGIGSNVDRWSQELNDIGVATFILDCFTGRGIVTTVTDQTQLASLAMLHDAYRALEMLSKHPRINSARIAVMGFSKGGVPALYASLKRFQKMYGPAGTEFCAYLAFYPPCNTKYIEDNLVSERPIRIFHGASDDYVPVAPCRAYMERLKASGKDVHLFEYPGAHHGFDAHTLKAPISLPQAQTARRCTYEEKPGGLVVNVQTNLPFSFNDACMERGTTVAYNAAAYLEALKTVKEFLKTTFSLK